MGKKKKIRLDAYLVEQGFFETRSKAQAAIMAGQVLADDQKIDKPGTSVKEGTKIRILGEQLRYVSRGGTEAGKGIAGVSPVRNRKGYGRCWRIHRRIYGLRIAKRGGQGVCH